jgi:hypothetical protein
MVRLAGPLDFNGDLMVSLLGENVSLPLSVRRRGPSYLGVSCPAIVTSRDDRHPFQVEM